MTADELAQEFKSQQGVPKDDILAKAVELAQRIARHELLAHHAVDIINATYPHCR